MSRLGILLTTILGPEPFLSDRVICEILRLMDVLPSGVQFSSNNVPLYQPLVLLHSLSIEDVTKACGAATFQATRVRLAHSKSTG